MSRVHRTLAIAASILLLTGCNQAQDAELQSVGFTLPELSSTLSPADFTALPFNDYSPAVGTQESAQRAHAQRLQDCAAEYNAKFELSGDYLSSTTPELAMRDGWPGTLTEDHARKFGYHADPEGSSSPVGGFYLKALDNVQLAPIVIQDDGVIPKASLVFYGASIITELSSNDQAVKAPLGFLAPEIGCADKVEAQLQPLSDRVIQLQAQLVTLALEHPAVLEASATWRTCMDARGFTYDSVQAPAESFSGRKLTRNELLTAQADVTCTQSSQWAEKFYEALNDYQKQAIAIDPQIFSMWRDAQETRIHDLLG